MKRTLFVEERSASGVKLEVIQDRDGSGSFYPIDLEVETLNLLLGGVTARTELSMLC